MKVRTVLLSAGAAWVVALGTVLGPVGSGAGHAAVAGTSGTPGPAVGSTVGQQGADSWFSITKVAPRYPDSFFPQVQDGYKDYQQLYWWSHEYDGDENAPYGADYTVTNSDGEIVFTGHVGTDETVLRWRGVDDAGEPVPVGVYTLTLTAYDAEGGGHVLVRQASVSAGEKISYGRVAADATTPRRYRTATRGDNCDVRKKDRSNLVLSCSGGRGFAKAVFTLNVPAKQAEYAEIIRYGMSGTYLSCRDHGGTKKAWKVDRDTIKASIKVTGRCSYRVYGAVMRYKLTTPL